MVGVGTAVVKTPYPTSLLIMRGAKQTGWVLSQDSVPSQSADHEGCKADWMGTESRLRTQPVCFGVQFMYARDTGTKRGYLIKGLVGVGIA